MMSWWQERTTRERLMLQGVAVAVSLLAIFQFIYAPINSYRDASIADYRNALALLTEMEEGAARAALATHQPSDGDGQRTVRVVATELAREMGLIITRLTPSEDDGLSVWIDGAEGTLLFRWLLRLRDEQGVRVQRAAIHKGSGANLAAEFTLSRG